MEIAIAEWLLSEQKKAAKRLEKEQTRPTTEPTPDAAQKDLGITPPAP